MILRFEQRKRDRSSAREGTFKASVWVCNWLHYGLAIRAPSVFYKRQIDGETEKRPQGPAAFSRRMDGWAAQKGGTESNQTPSCALRVKSIG